MEGAASLVIPTGLLQVRDVFLYVLDNIQFVFDLLRDRHDCLELDFYPKINVGAYLRMRPSEMTTGSSSILNFMDRLLIGFSL